MSGQDSSDDCQCDVSQGFSTVYINGTRKCTAGKYSTTLVASLPNTCMDCGTNSYSAVAGATGGDTCTNCPPGSVSPGGSIALVTCICNLGLTGPNGGTCIACEAGKYKDIQGNQDCTPCDAGKYLTTTGATMASSCVECTASKYSMTLVASLPKT